MGQPRMNGRQARNRTFAVLTALAALLLAFTLAFWETITVVGLLAAVAFALGGRNKQRRRR